MTGMKLLQGKAGTKLFNNRILGEKTNCCQTIDNAGGSCVEYGATKPNSGFIKFTLDGQIIGQSWIWYNQETGMVCLDNIEVPTIWEKELKKAEVEKSFLDCLKRLSIAIKTEMEKNGHKVSIITIGEGFNDLPGLDKFTLVSVAGKHMLPEDYYGYSDAKMSQFILATFKEKTNVDDLSK